MTKKFQIKAGKAITFGVFVILGFIALQIPINNLAGANVKFTLFDLFAPSAGAFLGTGFGILAVLVMQVINLILGSDPISKGSVIRLFPVLFGVWFFAKRDIKFLIVPLLAIVSFNLNEVGRSVWYFSMFWLIPLAVYPLVKKSLVARSLASTFVAHSVGGAIWIWAFNLPASVWQNLIPVVAMERLLMALGISASYILMTNVVAIVSKRLSLKSITPDKRYVVKLLDR